MVHVVWCDDVDAAASRVLGQRWLPGVKRTSRWRDHEDLRRIPQLQHEIEHVDGRLAVPGEDRPTGQRRSARQDTRCRASDGIARIAPRGSLATMLQTNRGSRGTVERGASAARSARRVQSRRARSAGPSCSASTRPRTGRTAGGGRPRTLDQQPPRCPVDRGGVPTRHGRRARTARAAAPRGRTRPCSSSPRTSRSSPSPPAGTRRVAARRTLIE